MRALTIWQPWASAIAYGPKRVENRKRPPPSTVEMPFEMAVHAAKTPRPHKAELADGLICAQLWPKARDAPFPRGSVVAVARVHRWDLYPGYQYGWVTGPICWHLDSVRALAEPVPCRGQQGLWTLPQDVEAEVRRQLGAA